MEDFLSDFNAHLSSPDSYLHPTKELKAKSLEALKTFFNFYKKYAVGELGALEGKPGCRPVNTGPLSELYTEGLDSDQIWEQIQLANVPVLKGLSSVGRNISGKLERGNFHLFAGSVGSNSRAEGGDPELKSGTDCGERVHGEPEGGVLQEESDELDSEYGFSDEDFGENKSGRGREKVRQKKSIVDDQFFKLAEMEKFLEMAEKEEVDSRG